MKNMKLAANTMMADATRDRRGAPKPIAWPTDEGFPVGSEVKRAWAGVVESRR